jgi:hypothetical protein
MKTLIKYVLALLTVSSFSVQAQQSSLDSPHNYKRPVFQQNKALKESNKAVMVSQSDYKIQNNINSVHNYKRQGVTTNFASETPFMINMPTAKSFHLNPLLASNHYKFHFRHTNLGKSIVQKEQQMTTQTTMNETKKESSETNGN